jgi:hypothetical protein
MTPGRWVRARISRTGELATSRSRAAAGGGAVVMWLGALIDGSW